MPLLGIILIVFTFALIACLMALRIVACALVVLCLLALLGG